MKSKDFKPKKYPLLRKQGIEPGALRHQVQRPTTWASTDLPQQSVGMSAFLEYINVKKNPFYEFKNEKKQ